MSGLPKCLGISFVIPVFNEELELPTTLASIRANVPEDIRYEIIVVDNGSHDNSVEIANESADIVTVIYDATVADLRNSGAKLSTFDTLVFLDADVRLTSEWKASIEDVLADMKKFNQITGSFVSLPTNHSWIERDWFSALARKKQKPGRYINSGHLIIPRSSFERIGGFDGSLISGEDYEICVRAARDGISIVPNPKLVAIHAGFPGTLKSFYVREKWHGQGDAQSIQSILTSRVAIFALFFGLLNLLTILFGIFQLWPLFAIAAAATIIACLIFSIKVCGRPSPNNIAQRIILAYTYLFARLRSIFSEAWNR